MSAPVRDAVAAAIRPLLCGSVRVFGSITVAAAQSRSDQLEELQEVVVTAQFREQRLQDTPIAITAVTAEMLEAGILDPTKVTRLALQNAASVAGLLLTTEVMIADAPKDEAEHSHGPPGGGMPDMGM